MRDGLKNASVFQDPELLKPLLIVETQERDANNSLLRSSRESFGPKKLTAAANRYGKPVHFDFSNS